MPVVSGGYRPCAGGFPSRLCARKEMETACGGCITRYLQETVRADLIVCLAYQQPGRWAALQEALKRRALQVKESEDMVEA